MAGLSREGQEKVEVCLWLATDGEDKVARGGDPHGDLCPPMMVNQLGGRLSYSLMTYSFPRSQASRYAFTKRQDFSTFKAGIIRGNSQDWAGKQ